MKYCKKCGMKYENDATFCADCGRPLSPCRNKKKWPFILLAALLIAALAVAAYVLFWGKDGPETAAGEDTGYNEKIAKKMEAVLSAAEDYTDKDGFVDTEDLEDAIDAVYEAARKEEAVARCYKDDYGVLMVMEEGPSYVYCPMSEDRDAGDSGDLKIVTLQPYYSENVGINPRMDHDGLEATAEALAEAVEEFSFDDRGSRKDDNVDDGEVTMDRILSLDDYSVILWHGHGGYSEKGGYYLCTNIPYDRDFCSTYGNIDNNDILITGKNRVCLKPDFFKHRFKKGAFDNAFIYIGTCYSGMESDLSDVLLSKGAAVVITNSESIYREYNLNMIHMISETFFCGASSKTAAENLPAAELGALAGFGEQRSIAQSFTLAKRLYGADDGGDGHAAPYFALKDGRNDLSFAEWLAGFDITVGSGDTPSVQQTVPELPAIPNVPEESEQPRQLTWEDIIGEELSWTDTKPFRNDYREDIVLVTYRCPQLDIALGNYIEINDILCMMYVEAMNDSGMEYGYYDGEVLMDYRIGGRDDVISILMKRIGYYDDAEYTVFNVRISTGELLSDEEFLREFNLRDAEGNDVFRDLTAEAAGAFALEAQKPMEEYGEVMGTDSFYYTMTVSEENLAKAKPLFVGENLCAVCPVYVPAGGGLYDFVLGLDIPGRAD